MKHILILLLIIIIPIQSYPAQIIGKVLEYNSLSGKPDLYPLFDEDTIRTGNKYILRLNGATLIADSNTEIKVKQETDFTAFYIAKGIVRFRISANTIRVLFSTPYGDVFTPRIAQTSSNIIDGKITVKDTTILEINEGMLESRTINGISQIQSGEAVLLSQAQIAKPEPETVTDNNAATESQGDTVSGSAQNDEATLIKTPITEKIVELLRLIGEEGKAKTPLTPVGDVEIASVKEWDGKGEVVDYDLSRIKDAIVPQGSKVKVICINIEGEEDSQLLVRPLDKLYPEQEGEKTLINENAEAQSDMQPEGFIKLKADDDDEDLKNRSLENWNAVVVGNDMQPADGAYILEDTDLKVVCLRTALLVKPSFLVNKEHVDIVGKTAVLVKEFVSQGKVNVEGKIYDAMPVDYNLQLRPNFQVPVGTELTVVGVRGSDSTLLVQNPDEVLEVLQFVGNTVEASDNMKPYGEVLLGNEDIRKWAAVIVTNDLIPFYGVEIEKGTSLTVVSVFTQLLVTESDVLVGWYDPSAASVIASALASPIGIGAAVGTAAVVTTVTVISTGNDGGGDGDQPEPTPPPEPPPTPEPTPPPPVDGDDPVVSPIIP